MCKRSKRFLLFIVSIVLSHGIAFILLKTLVIPHIIPRHSLIWWLIAGPLILIPPVIFALKVESWQQFALYTIFLIVAWQFSTYLSDRAFARTMDLAYVIESQEPWLMKMLRGSILPLALISLGTFIGILKRRRRFA
jgi:hypothetical protein